MPKILKEPKTYEEQVSLIREKGFIINDEERCIKFLHKANYYRLSAYYLPFLDLRSGEYFKGIPFERIQHIYEFDQKLRSLIFGTIEEIEFYLRTQLAYYHAHTYGTVGYLDAKSFNSTHDHVAFMKHIQTCIEENKLSLVVKHHKNNYQGQFPLWVVIEYFSMGMLSYFYRDMVTHDKKMIAKELYGTTPLYVESWLRCLTDLRNKCAHYSRIYYWLFSAVPRIPPDMDYIAGRRVFAQLVILKSLYPEPNKWNDAFFIPLKHLITQYEKDISLKHLDFPITWEKFLKH